MALDQVEYLVDELTTLAGRSPQPTGIGGSSAGHAEENEAERARIRGLTGNRTWDYGDADQWGFSNRHGPPGRSGGTDPTNRGGGPSGGSPPTGPSGGGSSSPGGAGSDAGTSNPLGQAEGEAPPTSSGETDSGPIPPTTRLKIRQQGQNSDQLRAAQPKGSARSKSNRNKNKKRGPRHYIKY